jgi:hypothetical protein
VVLIALAWAAVALLRRRRRRRELQSRS